MKAGQLRTLIFLQAPATGVDAVGQPAAGWVDIAQVWADVRHQSGIEAIKADAVVSQVKVSIRIRHREDVTSAMRAVADAETYIIHAVLPNRARGYIDLVCEVSNAF